MADSAALISKRIRSGLKDRSRVGKPEVQPIGEKLGSFVVEGGHGEPVDGAEARPDLNSAKFASLGPVDLSNFGQGARECLHDQATGTHRCYLRVLNHGTLDIKWTEL